MGCTIGRDERHVAHKEEVQGLTKARLILKKENRVDVENSATPQGLVARYSVFQPSLKVEVGVWGRITLPIHSSSGHYGCRSWRPIEEESLELVK
ncbi:hypothetical protein SLEP1_g15220 [Rubroshorea leprosula]|uniref:Uncharacterized protein n=1 Tax=Rubroshorea leprosula TaxID=152421 RepID=A0AAV5ISQ5_9ROSI|nr:hypothetical protein SLEP1_g15220 [Rubroshorea leprosula]